MKINIENKYLYITDDSDNTIAYFEHFESVNEKKKCIALAIEDKKGKKFLKENHFKLQFTLVKWFDETKRKSLQYRVMFVHEKCGALSYLILIDPKLLVIKSK